MQDVFEKINWRWYGGICAAQGGHH